MRALGSVLVCFLVLTTSPVIATAQTRAPAGAAARAAEDLARARALDKEGAKAYGDGRAV